MTTIRDLALAIAERSEPDQPAPGFIRLISHLHGDALETAWTELVGHTHQYADLRDGVIGWAEIEDPHEPYTGFAKQEAALNDAWNHREAALDELLPARRDITTLTVTEGRL